MKPHPTAARGAFPYPHRTLAEVDADKLPKHCWGCTMQCVCPRAVECPRYQWLEAA